MKRTNNPLFSMLCVALFTIFISCGGSEEKVTKTQPSAIKVGVQIEPNQAVGKYSFYDKDGDTEGTSTFKWYRADDINGKNETVINNATQKTYSYTKADNNKFLAFEVTPVQTDNVRGNPVKSLYIKNPYKVGITVSGSKDKITLYTVSGNKITKKQDYEVNEGLKALQTDTQKHQKIWEQILKVVPQSHLSKINEFMIYAGDFSSSADLYGALGYVFPTNNDLSTWQFGIAIDLAYQIPFNDLNNGVNGTIIHEFGHIVTLNNEQVNSSATSCSTYSLNEGCATNDSYIYKFYTNYWKDTPSENTADQNYKANPNNYVSEYAATNISEDIAETFRVYVLSATPSDNTIVKNKKIIELNGYQNLQNLRTSIRSKIGSSSFYSRNTHQNLSKFNGCGTSIMMHKARPTPLN